MKSDDHLRHPFQYRYQGDGFTIDFVEEPTVIWNGEAEMAALGSMILKEQAATNLVDALTEDDFFLPAHRIMFEAMSAILERGSKIDLVTLKNELVDMSKLDDVGGEEALIEVAEAVPSAANAMHYANILTEKSCRRRLLGLAQRFVKLSRTQQAFDPAIEWAIGELEKIRSDRRAASERVNGR